MNPETYARLKQLVLAARMLPAEDREPYLRRASAADPSLLHRALSLLGEADAVPELLAAADPAPAGAPPLPERIGPYEILGILGEGGMGIVYHARQTEPIQREVALKLVRGGLASARVAARFEAERQTLALMDHPGIARVIDAGTDAGGRPYVVMELVRGMPLPAHADAHRLGLRPRIELFLQVCRAVQHAHQKGIIHRDLKPSNVLVTEQDGRPQPKVIDFGIAKATEESFGAEALLTQEGQILGTPEYMSPEQATARRDQIDTRTDVYSLGVLLYELLTGRRPYRFRSMLLPDIQRAIAEDDPMRPSEAVTRTVSGDPADPASLEATRGMPVDRLRRQLAGDLDTILLMALRKEPDRRYPSVEQFAEDLKRYLEGRPVIARRDTFSYRAGKFVRRNRVPVFSATAAAFLLCALAVGLAVQSGRVARERDRALEAEARAGREAASTRRVSDFMVDLFLVADPQMASGDTLTARSLLDKGAARIDEELAEDPEIRAALMSTMARAYSGIGAVGRAVPLAEEALATRIRLFGEESLEAAETYTVLGAAHASAGDMAQAEPAYRRGLAIRRALLGPDHEEILESASLLALALQTTAQFAEAESLYRETLAMTRRLYGEDDPAVTQAIANVAGICHSQERLEEADSLLTLALERARRENANLLILADILSELGVVLKNEERYEEAEPHYREALAIRERVLGDHPHTAQSHGNLGVFLRNRGNEEAALPHLEKALAIHRRLKGEHHLDVAIAWNNLARGLSALGRSEEAEAAFRNAISSIERSMGRGYWVHSQLEYNYGSFLADRNRNGEAEPLLVRGYDGLSRGLGPDAHRTRLALEKLIEFYEATGRPSRAGRYRALLASATTASP